MIIGKTLLFAAAFIGGSLHSQAQKDNDKLHQLFEAFSDAAYALNPLQATFDGIAGFNDQLPPDDERHLSAVHHIYTKYLEQLKVFERMPLSKGDRICCAIMENQIQSVLVMEKYHLEYMPINQFTGIHLTMAILGSGTSVQPFKTVKDYDNWLKRCKAFSRWTDVAITNMRKGIASGMVLPKSLVLKIIPQLTDLIKTDNSSVFYGPTKMYPDSFSADEKQLLDSAFKKTITQDINSSFKKLLVFFQNEYLPKARLTSGINALPNGKQMYKDYIFVSVSQYKDPEEVYKLGLKEVARISAEMEKIKDAIGFKGSLNDLFEFMKTDKQFMPFKTDKEVLAAYQNIYDRIKPNLPKYFGVVPKTPFEIRKTEDFRAASASAEYYPGDLPSNRPGIFYVPILDPAKVNVTNDEMESLFLHEAIPGHHYQISLQYENTSVPKIRQKYWSSAFGEGWALYCESLGKALGVLTDPYHQLGALGAEIHRAIRLVVDAGLHTGKMTREQAIAYNMEHEPISEASATAEIERYMAWPGQALSYKIGELKIKELRDKYKKQLGNKFSIHEFHDAILEGGVMPLDTFESYMDDWADHVK